MEICLHEIPHEGTTSYTEPPVDLTKSMPWDGDAEKGVLSCFFAEPSLLNDAQVSVPDEAFYHPSNVLIFQTFKRLQNEGKPVDYISVSVFMRDSGIIDKVGGAGTLSEILNFVPTPAHYGYYKDILREKRIRREIIKGCMEAMEEAYVMQDDVTELMARTADRFFELTKQSDGVQRKTFKQHMADYVDVWEDRLHGRVQTGIPTRWPSFNAAFGGITKGMWLICAYPSSGKSSLKQNLVEDTVAQGGHVLDFSYESDETEIIDRHVTAHTELGSKAIFYPVLGQGQFPRENSRKITRAVGDLQNWGLHMRCEGTWTAEQIVAETRAMLLKHPIKLVCVDYLQLVPTSKDSGDSRAERVAHVSRTLKRGSLTLGIPFLVLSQLNDDGKTLDSRAPTQDAHNIIKIEDPGEFTEGTGKHAKIVKHPGGLRVAKGRNVERNKLLPIILDGANFTFREYKPAPPSDNDEDSSRRHPN